MAIKDYTLYQQSDFAKLGDCIGYYQDYQLTKHKYHNRRKALAYFDNVSLEKYANIILKVSLVALCCCF